MSRSGGALKQATPRMKYQYMRGYLDLMHDITENPNTFRCPECGSDSQPCHWQKDGICNPCHQAHVNACYELIAALSMYDNNPRQWLSADVNMYDHPAKAAAMLSNRLAMFRTQADFISQHLEEL